MFQQQQQNRQQFARDLAGTGVALLTVLALGAGVGAVPAAAGQDPGPTAARGAHVGECPLQRVDTQYVRCDNNTGNGVPAPAWVPARPGGLLGECPLQRVATQYVRCDNTTGNGVPAPAWVPAR